uniref:JAB1/MPN/MOV34 metalloenzyme domain-containing protein n=1 Tax=Setaria digitata TaxID=48799 RepID=A0A915PH89_9BILA
MASTLTVKVHPVVYLTIVDAFERRSNKPGANDKALGTLMGFYEKNAIQVTNCYAIPFREQKEDTPELDDGFNQTMLMMMKRATPSEQPVGWFYTNADLSIHCLPYHDYYNRLISESSAKKEPPPVILLTVDTTFNSPDEIYRMPDPVVPIVFPTYFIHRIKAGIPGTRDPHCAIFNPLKVEFDAFPGEGVALSLVQGGTAYSNKQREVVLENGLEQLEKSTAEMVIWLERLLKYVNEVLDKPELPVDSSLGRRMMDIVSAAAARMSDEKLDILVKTSLRLTMTSSGGESLQENTFESLFPRIDLSDASLGSSENANAAIFVNSSIVLRNQLSSAACFALVDLIASVLRLDFWQDNDNLNDIEFCTQALEKILKYAALPERTNATVRHHLRGEGATDDIATFVTLVKNDPFVEQKGASVILASLLAAFTEHGTYDCRHRVLLRHICALLALRWDDFEDVEDALVDTVTEHRYEESKEQKMVRARATRLKKIKRYFMIAAASSVGGILVGVTGGLAAPLVATGAGAVIGAGAAAGIATTAGATVLGSIFGVAGAGLTGYKMRKRVGAIEEFLIQPISEGRSLHCVLAVSGWIEDVNFQLFSPQQEERVFQQQWRHLWMSREQYVLRYESKYLVELGRAIDYLMSFAVSAAVQHTLLETAFAGLVAAVAWPVALLSASSVIDNPWNVCVGEQLAEVLLSRAHGNRPITLIGFSLGARVIFHCLMAMTKRSTCFGIVNDVVLLGAPVSASPIQWQQISRVVGGRIINGYCNNDWLLRFIYRTMSVQFTIAGTGPITCKREKKIVNFNLSHLVKGHLDYSRKLTEVLQAVGVRVTPHLGESMLNVSEDPDDLGTAVSGSDVREDQKLFFKNFYSGEARCTSDEVRSLESDEKETIAPNDL